MRLKTPAERLLYALDRIDEKYARRGRAIRQVGAFMAGTLVCAVLGALLGSGCPKPPPGPNRPDASDAAAPPTPTCDAVCVHVEEDLRCDTRGSCGEACGRIKRDAWRRCAAVAPTCRDVDLCGPAR